MATGVRPRRRFFDDLVPARDNKNSPFEDLLSFGDTLEDTIGVKPAPKKRKPFVAPVMAPRDATATAADRTGPGLEQRLRNQSVIGRLEGAPARAAEMAGEMLRHPLETGKAIIEAPLTFPATLGRYARQTPVGAAVARYLGVAGDNPFPVRDVSAKEARDAALGTAAIGLTGPLGRVIGRLPAAAAAGAAFMPDDPLAGAVIGGGLGLAHVAAKRAKATTDFASALDRAQERAGPLISRKRALESGRVDIPAAAPGAVARPLDLREFTSRDLSRRYSDLGLRPEDVQLMGGPEGRDIVGVDRVRPVEVKLRPAKGPIDREGRAAKQTADRLRAAAAAPGGRVAPLERAPEALEATTPEAPAGAAVRAPSGEILRAAFHKDAFDEGIRRGLFTHPEQAESGFMTNRGRFVDKLTAYKMSLPPQLRPEVPVEAAPPPVEEPETLASARTAGTMDARAGTERNPYQPESPLHQAYAAGFRELPLDDRGVGNVLRKPVTDAGAEQLARDEAKAAATGEQPHIDDLQAKRLGMPRALADDINLLGEEKRWNAAIRREGEAVNTREGLAGKVVRAEQFPTGERVLVDHGEGLQRWHSVDDVAPASSDFKFEKPAEGGPGMHERIDALAGTLKDGPVREILETVTRNMKQTGNGWRDAFDSVVEDDFARDRAFSNEHTDAAERHIESLTKREPAAGDQFASAETGKPFESKLLRGQNRGTSPYNEFVPQEGILGAGRYTTHDRAFAEHFGPDVTEHDVRLENPLVIDSDKQWRELTKEAGWKFSNPIGLDEIEKRAGRPPRAAADIANLRALLEKKGHDGVVVRVPESELTGKTLQDVFGASQALEFKPGAEAAKPTLFADLLPTERDLVTPGAAEREAQLEREGIQHEPVSLRTKSGKLPTNLRNVDAQALMQEYRALHEATAEDVNTQGASQRIFGSGDYADQPKGMPPTGDVGVAGTSAGMRAGGRIEARAKAIDRLGAELARRGLNPVDAFLTGREPKDAGEFPFGSNVSEPERRVGADELGYPRTEAERRGEGGEGTLFERYKRPDKAQLDLFKSPAAQAARTETVFGTEANKQAVIADIKARSGRFATIEPPAARFGKMPATAAWVDIRGKDVSKVADLHKLLYPFRDPRAERMHFILLDDAGVVLSHAMETSGALYYVDMVDNVKAIDALARRAERLGATRAVLAHNHPSGNTTPSADDHGFTNGMGYALSKRGIHLDGHLIIDHGTATWISLPSQGLLLSETGLGSGALELGTNWVTDQRFKVHSRSDLVSLLGQQDDISGLQVLYLDNQHRAIALEPHHPDAMKTVKTWLPAQMKGLGARTTLFMAPDTEGVIRDLTEAGVGYRVADVVRTGRDRAGPTFESQVELGEYAQARDPNVVSRKWRLFERGREEDAARGGPAAAQAGRAGAGEPARGVAAQVKPPGVLARLKDAFKILVDPASRTAQSAEAARIIRAHGGEMAAVYEQAETTLRDFRSAAERMPEWERLEFMDRMETGRKQVSPALGEAAAHIRQTLDRTRDEIIGLGTGKLESYIENYLPHIWKNPDQAKGIIQAIMGGKRPLEGPKSFLKKRTIPTIKEGLAYVGKDGEHLELVSTNPVDLTLMKLREMQRYLMAQRVFDEMKKAKLVSYVPADGLVPKGYKRINDTIATVFGSPDVVVQEAFDAGVRDQLAQVIKDLPGLSHERKVNIGRRTAWGFAEGERRMVTKFGGDNTIIEHELGHIIDERVGLWKQLTEIPGTDRAAIEARKAVHLELRELADLRDEGETGTRTEHRKRYVRNKHEKMANALHALIYAPDRMAEVAPTVKAKLTAILARDPKLKPILDIAPSLKLGTGADVIHLEGRRIMGEHWAPEPVARVLNNYLSPGLRGNAFYDALRATGNTMNQAQLGMSLFHLGFTSMDAAVSRLALGIEQAYAGKPLKGLGSALSAVAAPVTNALAGKRIRAEYLHPGTQSGDIAALVQAVKDAGGRVRQDSFYSNAAPRKFLASLRAGRPDKAALYSLPALFELAARPVMEHIVPMQKLGVFGDMAREALEHLPEDATVDQRRAVMAKAWDSVDNRLGQLVYDNLFWDKTFKDVAMVSVRSVGWNLGTIREIGGGVADVGRQAARLAKGERFEVTHRMAYLAALPITVGLAGAVIQYLYTGKGPEELKDYYFPRTGTYDPDGNPNRVQLPSYMKDIAAYSRHPWQTVKHKVNPSVGTIVDMLNNQDFYGDRIRNEDAPLVSQLGQEARYLAKQFLPFVARNISEQAKREDRPAAKVVSFVGITPATREFVRTPAQNLMNRLQPHMTNRTPEQAEASRERRTILDKLRAGEDVSAELGGALDRGELTTAKMTQLLKQAGTLPMRERFKGLSLDNAITVYNAGEPWEREIWQDLLDAKIARAGKAP